MDAEIAKIYGNTVRVRVCGICWENDRLLLVNHQGITSTDFWAPPGGGIDFEQSIEKTLKREFEEETGLIITPGDFLFGCELIQKPLHAIELFFKTEVKGGELNTGYDPEIQIIREARFMSAAEITSIPAAARHGIFRLIENPHSLKDLEGFFRI